MKSYGARMIKVHSKTSWQNRSGKTNVRIMLLRDSVSQETFEYIYDVCPIKKFIESVLFSIRSMSSAFRFNPTILWRNFYNFIEKLKT